MTGKPAGRLRVGLVGCGRIAATHLEALARVPALELVGVCDVREDAARGVAEPLGVPACGDVRDWLDPARVDAVIVCTPPASHAAIAGDCLDRGVHVLCEKPLAVTTRDAETLVAQAARTGSVLMMASKFRYAEDVIAAKAIVDSGALGDLILYENVFCSKVDMRGRWNARRELAGGGVLIDNGTHSIDIARYLVGAIVEVQAEEGRRLQGLEVEDTCRLALRTDKGVMGAVDLSWSIHKERDAYIEIFGSQGILSIGWQQSHYRSGDAGDWIGFGRGYDKVAAFAGQLGNFVGTIRGEQAPLITAEDALESVRVIEAGYRSLERSDWVPVRSDAPGEARRGSAG